MKLLKRVFKSLIFYVRNLFLILAMVVFVLAILISMALTLSTLGVVLYVISIFIESYSRIKEIIKFGTIEEL